jgi:hypothetical protein
MSPGISLQSSITRYGVFFYRLVKHGKGVYFTLGREKSSVKNTEGVYKGVLKTLLSNE